MCILEFRLCNCKEDRRKQLNIMIQKMSLLVTYYFNDVFSEEL